MARNERPLTRWVRLLLGPTLMLIMLIAALWLLHQELRQYHLRDFVDSMAAIRSSRVLLAIALTVLNFLVLVGYDLLGIRYIDHSMNLRRVALASFLGYSVGNNFGTLLGGSTIRYRLYSGWGLTAVDIAKLVLILGLTFWIGLFFLAAVVFLADPLPIPARLHLPMQTTVPLGVILAIPALAYPALCVFRRAPLKIRSWEISPPPLGLCLTQYVVASADLMIAAGVLYVLLPDSLSVGYFHFLTVYLLALIVSFISQVPGGLGVLELIILMLLAPTDPHRVMGSLLVYRLVYYLAPLSAGILVLGGNEVAIHRKHVGRLATMIQQGMRLVAPRLLAVTVFVAGVVLLFSSATPAEHGRLHALRRLLPLPMIEVSHFLGSIVGVWLILLARGLQRRVETAYYATAALLSVGIGLSLLKGLDYEEALILAVMLALLLPCRRHFYRKGAMLTARLTPQWFVAVSLAVACTVWLTLFAYKHVEYSSELWWRFTLGGNAPRSLRALAGMVLGLSVIAVAWLLRVKPRAPALPAPADLETARTIIAASPRTSPHLALLGDKRILFNADRSAFLMYGIEGRSWVAMGDPVGADDAMRELAWEFCELCNGGGQWPVFYQVDEERVPLYIELGLALIKLGEAARVPLADFGLEGSARRGLRYTQKQLTKVGCRLEIMDAPLDDALLDDLQHISEAWLGEKHTAEKGFSLGFFERDYIRRCTCAVVRCESRTVAFANLWQGGGRQELSVDLMRHLPDAPRGVMEFLFIELMRWGRQQGYQWFNLGMAPLAGVEAATLGPRWNQFAALAYRHGEYFYRFQGLRQYKEKFHPVWTPKYLAYPGRFTLPIILTNVSTLISGGLSRLVKR